MAEGFKRGDRKLGTITQVNATDGSLIIETIGPGMTNPMLATGDMIYGGVGGTPLRLPKATDGQVLTLVSGNPAWATEDDTLYVTKSTLSADGDIFIRSGGAVTRLAIGTAGQVLTVSGGLPAWVTDDDSAYIAASVLIAKGDIIVRNSTVPTKLSVGTDTQVLTADSTTATGLKWATPAAGGMTNPMTTLGDIIYEDATPTPARLPIGSAGQVLTVSGGVPAWAASGGSITYAESDDTADVTLTANTPADATGASISLAAGTWIVTGMLTLDNAFVTYGLMYITDGSNNIVASSRIPLSGVNGPQVYNGFALVTPGSTTTYKLRGQTGHTGDKILRYADGTNIGTRIWALKVA